MLSITAQIPIQDLMLFVVFVMNFLLGVLIIFKNRKEKANIYLSLMSFSTAVWAIGLALFRITTNIHAALLYAQFYYLAAALIGFTFLSFSFVFPFQKTQPSFFYKTLFYLFTLSILFISIWPGVMIEKVEIVSWGKNVILGWPYFLYVTYFTLCMIGAFGNFIQKYRESKGVEKLQIKYVFWGLILAAIWGTIFNLFFPLAGNYKWIWLGPYFTLIMISFLTYSILKHHLLNIKVMATEIFSILISIFLLLDALLSKTKTEFFLKFGLFLVVTFFSYLLIRSVINEVKAKEKIAKISQDLKKVNTELKRLDQEKSDFLSIASHQLRTPMTVMKGYISMITEGMFGEIQKDAKNALSKIYVSNQRLIKLVNDLLNLSRIERGKMRYNFQKDRVEKVVKDVISQLKPVAEQKGLFLDYEKPVSKIPEIIFDTEYIRQVIINLLDNAIKYTQKGGIKVSISTNPQKIILAVKDSGAGIATEEIGKIFKRYQRGLKQGAKGLGMGLYIAKKIVDDHKGKIWAKSEGKGKGTTFFVELPIS
jgi:signal transduction histidine kinase